MFTIDLKNIKASDFCQFTQLLPMAVMWPEEVCSGIVNCIATMIRNDQDSLRTCITGLFTGVAEGFAKSFAKLGKKVEKAGATLLQLGSDMWCQDDPGLQLDGYIEQAINATVMFTKLGANIQDYFDKLGDSIRTGLESMTNGDFISILISKDESFQIGADVKTTSQGIFCTFRTYDIKQIFTKHGGKWRLDLNKRGKRFRDMLKRGKYGYWEGEENERTTDVGLTVGLAGTVQILAGDSTNWGGHGFAITMGMDIPVAGIGLDIGLVFAATYVADGKPAVADFIGFAFTLGISPGFDSGVPFSLSSIHTVSLFLI